MDDNVISGFSDMNKRIFNLISAMPDEIKNALVEESKENLAMMLERTPIETGALRASGMVHPPEFAGHETSVKTSFGNDEVYYAWFVHEDLEAHHPVGQAKFMESVLLERADGFSTRVGARIKFERMGVSL